MDLEGIVAKHARSPYTGDVTTWLKIKNPNYSQLVGRDDMFEPEGSPWLACERAMRGFAGQS